MEILVYILRCIVMFIVTFTGLRIIGKKSIAQLTTYELAGVLLLVNVAAEPLTYKIPSKATIGVFTLVACMVVLGFISLSKKFYNLDAKPNILISKGIIDYQNLKSCRINITFLLSLLRLQGHTRISDIEFAILEPNGNISVITKPEYRAVKPIDLNITVPYDDLPFPIIIDGILQEENFKNANITKEWLTNELKKQSVNNIKDVLYAELDNTNKLYVSVYKKTNKILETKL